MLSEVISRWMLGLRARPMDIDIVRREAPELLSEHPRKDQVSPESILLLPSLSPTFVRSSLRKWLGSVDISEPTPLSSTAQCPVNYGACPLNVSEVKAATQPDVSRDKPTPSDSPADPTVFQSIVAGGAAREGGKRFINLLQKVTKGLQADRVKAVTITDRFLDTSFDEEGAGEGYTWLEKIFDEGLGISSLQSFNLHLSPSLKNFDRLAARLRQKYKKAEIDQFTVHGSNIHDRFYLVRGETPKGVKTVGVHGPSLNGLDGRAVFLMGDLDSDAVKALTSLIRTK